jgi:hypothetical protein
MVPGAADQTFFFQVAEMLVNRRQRAQLEVGADLFQCRRISMPRDVRLDVVEDLLLSLGQEHDDLPFPEQR